MGRSGNSRVRERARGRGVALDAAILSFGPKGYWQLNDSNNQATDYSGNARHGTYLGTGFTLQGATGGDGALYVDMGNAASSEISIADNNDWSANTASGITVIALIKPDSVGGTTTWNIFTKGTTAAFEWGLTANSGVAGRLNFTTWNATGVTLRRSDADGVLSTGWQLVAANIDSPTTSSVINMYRNNATSIGTLSTSGGTPYANNAAQLRIGWRADQPANQYFQGGMAHVALFAGQLTSVQIGTLMTAADDAGWF